MIAGNSTPRFIRSTLHSIPSTHRLAKTVHIPIALHVQPFAEQPPEEDPIPVVDYGDLGPPRCDHCRAYINPWCRWKAGGARWECNLCEHANEGEGLSRSLHMATSANVPPSKEVLINTVLYCSQSTPTTSPRSTPPSDAWTTKHDLS